MSTQRRLVWYVTDHHHPPRRLHLRDCDHLTSPRPDYDPDWREPVGTERNLPHCQHCEERAAQL